MVCQEQCGLLKKDNIDMLNENKEIVEMLNNYFALVFTVEDNMLNIGGNT